MTILFNLKVHAKLLEVLEDYSKRGIKVLVNALMEIDSSYNSLDFDKYSFIDDSYYDITLI